MRKSTIGLSVLLLGCIALTLSVGRYPIHVIELIKGLLCGDLSPQVHTLFFQMRLPRMLLVLISGGALAIAGLVYQSIFKNPLVSPDVLGVSSGCSVGAICAIIFMGQSSWMLQGVAFLGGCLVVVITMTFAQIARSERTLALIMSGIMVSALASSFIMFLKYLADPYKQLPTIEFWLMGGFYNATYSQIVSILIPLAVGFFVIYFLRWPIGVMALGDEQALSLGISVEWVRILALLAATLLVAAVVSVAGVVSWIGLLIPHLIKKCYKGEFRYYLIDCFLLGALVLLGADTLARTMLSVELPISILTTLIGAPFLGYLIVRRGRESECR
ncbi:MAG: FecCD family ABC transporter permease [Cellulosilyticaceae bacterium]